MPPTTIAPEFFGLLRCPRTMQPLRMASGELLERLRLQVPGERLEEALVREDGAVAYPVRDGLPVLLPEAAIALLRE